MGTLVTIGVFSRMTHLSIKTLRHYHDLGLLEPAAIDPFSGYRSYDTSQVPTAQVIRRLRDLTMPLDQIRAVLTAPDVGARNQEITAHLDRMERQLMQTQSSVRALRALLKPKPGACGRGTADDPGRDRPRHRGRRRRRRDGRLGGGGARGPVGRHGRHRAGPGWPARVRSTRPTSTSWNGARRRCSSRSRKPMGPRGPAPHCRPAAPGGSRSRPSRRRSSCTRGRSTTSTAHTAPSAP